MFKTKINEVIFFVFKTKKKYIGPLEVHPGALGLAA
jgi:hypothetical protein